MLGIVLLATITVLYAGYNLFIKLSGGYVPVTATTTILATICLQLGALFVSTLFLTFLISRGGHEFALTTNSYLWAVVAGLCIGGAEIGYFYLFSGIGIPEPMPSSIAIPAIVSGTIVISLLFSYAVLKEIVAWNHLLGCALIVIGIVFLFGRRQLSV